MRPIFQCFSALLLLGITIVNAFPVAQDRDLVGETLGFLSLDQSETLSDPSNLSGSSDSK
ncbi:hypothetical protein BDQ17DRAFT_1427900 [Cyathus striatus]|nr:hypothetical protein BDQ17DRAFT_1427900 [Cyathus striatus]